MSDERVCKVAKCDVEPMMNDGTGQAPLPGQVNSGAPKGVEQPQPIKPMASSIADDDQHADDRTGQLSAAGKVLLPPGSSDIRATVDAAGLNFMQGRPEPSCIS
jgi:hypothetical protein